MILWFSHFFFHIVTTVTSLSFSLSISTLIDIYVYNKHHIDKIRHVINNWTGQTKSVLFITTILHNV